MIREFWGWENLGSIADATGEVTSYTGNPAISIGSAYGRFGNGALLPIGCTMTKTFSPYDTDWKVGFAARFPAISTAVLLRCKSVTGTNIYLQLNSDGTLQLRNGYGTLLGTSQPLVVNTWHYIEIGFVVHNSAGTATLKLDGITNYSGTGLVTNRYDGYVNNFVFQGGESSLLINWHLDDVYFVDSDASDPENPSVSFLGDSKVVPYALTADGYKTDFTCSTGSDHYANIDDTDPDDDTTYNHAATVGLVDTFVTANTDTENTIHGVRVKIRGKKTDAGTRGVVPVLYTDATTEYAGDEAAMSTSYTTYKHIWGRYPVDDSAWDKDKFNALQFGYKVSS